MVKRRRSDGYVDKWGISGHTSPVMTVGEWIREERQRRGWSQDTLAHRSEVSARLIGGYERGEYEPSLETTAKILGAFELELPWDKGRYLPVEILQGVSQVA